MPMPRKPRGKCLNCNEKEVWRSGYKYCSNLCQRRYEHQEYLDKWKQGEISGLMSLGLVSQHIKRYLREKFYNRCCICGWSEVNLKTGQIPLVADHIDGNWRNNREENLRLLCPNCDSLNPTFAGLNRGRGREGRVRSKRAREARSLFFTKPK